MNPAEPISFDLSSEPPTGEQIEARISCIEDQRAALSHRAQRGYHLALCVHLSSVAVCLLCWRFVPRSFFAGMIAFLLAPTLLTATAGLLLGGLVEKVSRFEPPLLLLFFLCFIASLLISSDMVSPLTGETPGWLDSSRNTIGTAIAAIIAFILGNKLALDFTYPRLESFVFNGSIEKIHDLNAESSLLDPVRPADCQEILDQCKAFPFLARYQGKVALMDRPLVEGEGRAIRRWASEKAESSRIEEAAERERLACLALRKPIENAS